MALRIPEVVLVKKLWALIAAKMPRSRRGRVLLGIAVLVLAGGFILIGRGSHAPAGGPGGPGRFGDNRPMPVVAQAAERGDIDIHANALGTVVARNTVTVKTRVDGQLLRLNFREGQSVREGELLAEIDPRPFQAALTQAEGQLERDQALLANARIDLERYRSLHKLDSISKQQLDTQEALVRQYEGTQKIDQGNVDNARLQLAYTRITAPVSGRVGLRQVDPGNIVHASDSNGLIVLTQERPITVLFSLPEDSLPPVLEAMRGKAPLTVLAFDREQRNKLASGELLTADNQIDTTTGTVKLKAQFANDDGKLYPNQFVNVRLHLATRHDALLVPSAAVQRGQQGPFVYVVKDDQTVALHSVKLGPVQGERTAIEDGLQAGEQVVVDGADKLRDGSKVEVIKRDSSAGGNNKARRSGS